MHFIDNFMLETLFLLRAFIFFSEQILNTIGIKLTFRAFRAIWIKSSVL